MRDFSLPPTEAKKRSPYKLPERTQMMQDIYSLILEGYPYNKIMQQLQISERTFYRYLEVIFANDRRLLLENVSDEEFLNQMIICKDRLLEQRRDVLEIAHDPEIDDQVRINAHHLAAEIAAAVLRIYEGGPAILSQRHAFPKTAALTAPGTTGLKLVLNNDNDNDDDGYDNNNKETAMKKAFRLQYEEAMKQGRRGRGVEDEDEEEVREQEGEFVGNVACAK
jgi:hypothetical protein